MTGNGRAVPQIAGATQQVPDTHRTRVEELHAHLANEHGCGMAQAIVSQLMRERVEAAARFAPVRADGTQAVNVDMGEVLNDPHNRGRFEALHRAHHEEPGYPHYLHPWMEGANDGEG